MTTALNFDHFDTSVPPTEDLFRHANGAWLKEVTIAADKSGAGAFIDLRDASEAAVRDIITSTGGGDASDGERRKIADLYASFMDTDRVEALGATPLQPVLARIDAITDARDLSAHLGWSLRNGFSSLIGFGEDSDPGNPQRYVMFTGQAGLGLPDEEYYRLEEHAHIREAYRAHLERVLGLAGMTDAAAQADAVFALETRIASHHWDKVRTRDLRQMYNPMTWEEFTASTSGIDWNAFAEAAELPVDKVADLVVGQPSFATAAADLVATGNLDAWKSWARWKAVSALSAWLSSDFVDARFDFYERTLQGTEQLRDRWKRGVSLVEGVLGEAIGKIYVERHFQGGAKEAMDELVANLLAAYRISIEKLDWMTETTRAEALDKLSKFRPKIGFPEQWRDYSALQVTPDDLVGNVLAANSFELDHTLEKLGGPMDPHEWLMFPQTVNAYYHPLRNEIVFPAAILQPPFFNVDADDAVNYAAIGAVIGHEIGHGFDDKGSTCDGDGMLRDWWSAEDREAFEQRTHRLISQYNELSPEGADGVRVNGELTVGENIGDLGGLGIAWKAWLLAGGDPNGEEIDGLTPGERFFFGWAAAWRGRVRPEAMKQRLATDPHSPAEFRCNQIVRNLDAFHETFGTTEDDGLWLAPEERVVIW
ncbi:M13 family metallopeptidase [Tessaracoccus antarcticus]|uniref:Peptidase M13 n=1 Tax=Tessaracoccus antarcticus TaxID=2479848 RepID=A0A3M0GBM7_9ACTN|nr:M13-type metalloendopeptidase [Tessaracoccus antarcticus]RMB58459.1 peptidase M13 [Tessaracoccus antarcticus]